MSIQFRTRGNSNPHGKQRVYFTCHTDDFEEYADTIISKVLEKVRLRNLVLSQGGRIKP